MPDIENQEQSSRSAFSSFVTCQANASEESNEQQQQEQDDDNRSVETQSTTPNLEPNTNGQHIHRTNSNHDIPSPSTNKRGVVMFNTSTTNTAISTDSGSGSTQAHLSKIKRFHELKSFVEIERLKHRLACEHFENRSFYFLFLPITALTMASGVLATWSSRAFNTAPLPEGATEPKDGQEYGSININLVFASGLLSFFTTFMNSVQDRLGFRGQAEMHETASLQLKKMNFELELLQVQIHENGLQLLQDVNEFSQALSVLERAFSEIQEGCKSILPSRINEPFAVLLNRIKTRFQQHQSFQNVYENESSSYIFAANELSGAISSWQVHPYIPYGYPSFLPQPNTSVKLALKNIDKSVLPEQQMQQTQRAQMQLRVESV